MTEDSGKFVEYDPADMPQTEVYQLLTSCVAPRPIAFASTVSAEGVPNLAPFSFFMAGGSNPPSIAFSPSTARSGSPKDTLRNIRETGEFTINVVTYAMRDPMNQTSAEYPFGISEWDEVGLTPAPCQKVRPSRVLESPLSIECRLFQIVTHGPGPLSANYVIGEVVYFHVAKSILDQGRVDALRVDYIARLNADWYARANVHSMFALARPPRPQK